MTSPSFGPRRSRKIQSTSPFGKHASKKRGPRIPYRQGDAENAKYPSTRATIISRKNSAIARTKDQREVLIPKRDASLVRAGDIVELGGIRMSYDRLVGSIRSVSSSRSDLYTAEILRQSKGMHIIRIIDVPYDTHMRLSVRPDIGSELHIQDIIEVQIPAEILPNPKEARFVRRIARGDDPERFLITARSSLGLPGDFSEGAIHSIPEIDIEHFRESRVDYRGHMVWSVDGEDARDLDDALSIRRLDDGGYELFVHIADVSSYVPQGSAIDREASERATSIYLPEGVIPMLPEELSNHLCSLNTEGDKLTITATLTYDERGVLIQTDVHPSVIRSQWRGTYTAVGAYIAQRYPQSTHHIKPLSSTQSPPIELSASLDIWYDLSQLLFAQEDKRGKLEFESDELKVVRPPSGEISFEKRDRHLAHRMVEVSMIAANEAVAKYLKSAYLLTPARVHEPPSDEKIAMYLELEGAYLPSEHRPKGAEVSRDRIRSFLRKISSHPASAILERKILSTLSKAYYSHLRSGHFGLALSDYIHFTSPIRRYPDLLAHRILHAHWRGEGHAYRDSRKLESLLERSSERERLAITAERSIFDRYKIEYFRSRIHEIYDAQVTGILPSVIFVEIDPGLEVSIERPSSTSGYHLSHLSRDLESLALGDRIQVEIVGVDDVLVRVEGSFVKKKPERL